MAVIMNKIKIVTLVFVLLSFTLTAVDNVYSQQDLATKVKKGDIVINEVNWAGSSLSTADEWIELYNTTLKDIDLSDIIITGIGNGEPGIPLTGVIKATNTYLISNFSLSSGKTLVFIEPDKVEDKITISNSGFHIRLQTKNGFVIDDVNTGGKPPFKGSTGEVKTSMAKLEPGLPGNDPASWKNSNSRKNIQQRSEFCQKDYATPGSRNFNNVYELEIEFEDLCIPSAQLVSGGIQFNEPVKSHEVINLNHAFVSPAHRYEIEIAGDLKNKSLVPRITVYLEFASQSPVNFESEFKDDVVFEFVKPQGYTSANLTLFIDQQEKNAFTLDKLIIKKVSANPNDLEVDIFRQTTINSTFDSSINSQVIFIPRELKTVTIASSAKEINTSEIYQYNADFELKFTNVDPSTQPHEIISIIKVENRFTGTGNIKKIRYKDILESKFKQFSLKFISENYGLNDYKITSSGKADIYVSRLNLYESENNFVETVEVLDHINDSVYFEVANNKFLFNKVSNKSGKLVHIPESYLCFRTTQCNINFNIRATNYNSTSNNIKIADIYLVQSTGNNKYLLLSRYLSKEDFKDNALTLDFLADKEAGSRLSLIIYSYNNADIEFSDITVKPGSNTQYTYSSINKLDWSSPINLENRRTNKGMAGKIVDIIKPHNSLSPGDYLFYISLKNNFESMYTNKIIRIYAYDDKGKKLFDSSVSNKEISSNSNYKHEINFTISSISRINIVLRTLDTTTKFDIEAKDINLLKV
jgi:hypothetical protein